MLQYIIQANVFYARKLSKKTRNLFISYKVSQTVFHVCIDTVETKYSHNCFQRGQNEVRTLFKWVLIARKPNALVWYITTSNNFLSFKWITKDTKLEYEYFSNFLSMKMGLFSSNFGFLMSMVCLFVHVITYDNIIEI